MDPNANLQEQGELVREIHAIEDGADEGGDITAEQAEMLAERAFRLASLVEALDSWLVGGGFLPTRWERQ